MTTTGQSDSDASAEGLAPTGQIPAGTQIGRGVLMAAAVIIIIAAMKIAASLIVPFLLALFIVCLATPLISWLIQYRVPRTLAVVLVFAAVLLVFTSLGITLGASVGEFIERMPGYEQRLREVLQSSIAWLVDMGLAIPDESLLQFLDPAAAISFSGLVLQRMTSLLSNSLLIFMMVFFMIAEASYLPQKIALAFGTDDGNLEPLEKFQNNLSHYILIKSLASLLTGTVVWLLLTLLSVDFALLWGLLAFLLNFIPAIGSLIAAIPAILLALIDEGLGTAVLATMGYLIVNIAVGNVLEPRIMGNQLGLSALVVFGSLLFWGWVLGPVGMFLSVPLTIMLKIAMDTAPGTRWLAIMLSDHVEARTRYGRRNGPPRSCNPPAADAEPQTEASPH